MKLGLKNFRSFYDFCEVEIKPITIFVGSNSAGKSSFLRFFPLLKQTLETKRSEPLLWYGDYVDFGSFSEVKSKDINDNYILFSFEDEISYGSLYYQKKVKKLNTKVKLRVEDKDISYVELQIEDQNVIFFVKNEKIDKILINGDVMPKNNLEVIWGLEELLPIIVIADKSGDILPKSLKYNLNYTNKNSLFNTEFLRIYPDYKDEIEKEVSKDIKSISVSNNKYFKWIRSTYVSSKTNLEDSIKGIIKDLSLNELNENQISKLINSFIYDSMYDILNAINMHLANRFLNVSYLKPVRASAQRYYRKQGLQLEDIDSSGENIAMYLNNLSQKDIQSFEAWTEKWLNFKFKSSTKDGGGHITLNIIKNGQETNLADTGYGLSQMLPIIVQLWRVNTGKSKVGNRTLIRYYDSNYSSLVIEQPELHLHPKYQGEMMEMMVSVINESIKVKSKDEDFEFNLILETHSEAMINKLGYLVSTNVIASDLVNIVFFEKEGEKTFVSTANFDKNGILSYWPDDFFGI